MSLNFHGFVSPPQPFFKVHPCFARYPLHTWIIAIAARQHPACIYSYSLDLNGSCPTARSFTQQIWQQGTSLSQNHNDRFVALNLQVMGRFLRNGGQERFACLLASKAGCLVQLLLVRALLSLPWSTSQEGTAYSRLGLSTFFFFFPSHYSIL